MRRRLFSLAAAFGLLAATLIAPTFASVPARTCEECREYCNLIPMHPDDCREMYCPGCPSTSTSVPGGSGAWG